MATTLFLESDGGFTAVDVLVPASPLMTSGYTAALRPKSCVQ